MKNLSDFAAPVAILFSSSIALFSSSIALFSSSIALSYYLKTNPPQEKVMVNTEKVTALECQWLSSHYNVTAEVKRLVDTYFKAECKEIGSPIETSKEN